MNSGNYDLILDMAFGVIGGLGIFLLGMKNMSEGMQAVAGSRLRKMIGSVTSNRVAACGVGTLVTSIIQSSSVTTVMVVGFVNGGFMTLMQAIGVILGANVGTTITGFILALKIGKYGLPILGIAAFVYLFVKNERTRFTAMAVVGLGMVFFGLETMSAGFKNEQVKEVVTAFFSVMSGVTYIGVLKCAFAGCIATMIVQSSSATLGITIALAMAGTINFDTAAGLILGLNVGTTITAFLASLGASTNAKRAAYAHIIFNIVGTVWLLPIFFGYTAIIQRMGDIMNADIEMRIAMTHSGFNIINTIVFLPLMGLLANVVTKIIPDTPHKETPHLTFLDVRMLDTPAIGIQQSQDEINRMCDHTAKMFGMLRECLSAKEIDQDIQKKLFHREEIMDVVQKEITEFLSHILSGNISHDVVDAGRKQLRVADEYESISDYMISVMKLYLKLKNSNLNMSKEGVEEILTLHDRVADYTLMISDAVKSDNAEILAKAHSEGELITRLMKDYREKHLQRVQAKQVSALKSLIFVDILQSYRKIKDHALNIAEAVVGEK